MSNLKKSFKTDYTVLPNEIFRHGLTLQAIAIYTFIVSRPDNWDFSIAGTAAALDEGKDKIRNAVHLLENSGFLFREQIKQKGKFLSSVWTVYDIPLQANKRSKPLEDVTMLDDPLLDNTTAVNATQLNKDSISKEVINKEVITPAEKLKNEKTKFFKVVQDWKFKNPGKFPAKLYKNFFDYWTESDEINGTGKMRFQGQKHFEIGRRLSTFWNYVKDAERAEMWKADESIKPVVELQFEPKTID